MKLIYLANARMPTEKAHGWQIMRACREFARQGIELELWVPWRFNKIEENPFSFYNLPRAFKIKKIFCLDLIPLHKILGPVAFWIQTSSFALFVSLRMLWTLSFKVEVIYSRDEASLALLTLFFGRKINSFYEMHDYPRSFLGFYKFIFKRIKGIVVTNHWKTKRLIEDFFLPSEKILVATNGVDIEEFDIEESSEECRRNLGLPKDKKIIGYTGQLQTIGRKKGVGILIGALAQLKKKGYDDLILCLIGGSEKEIADYRKIAEKFNLSDQEVIFAGQKRHSVIPYYLRAFDVLAMPFPWTQHYAYFMCPMKMFEYMAAKKSIIASRLPTIEEVLSRKNALLVKPGNVEDLAKAIERLVQEPSLGKKLAQQAWLDVQQFSWQERAQKIIKFLKSKIV